MPTVSASWTENVTVRAAATLGAGASATDSVDMATLGADASVLLVDVTLGSSSGITIEVFDDVNSGSSPASEPRYSRSVTASGQYPITVTLAPFFDVRLTNDDGVNATGNISIVHAWRQWSSV